MNLAIPDRYLLADDFDQRANGLNFPAEVWNVAAELAEVSEATSPSELEMRTGQTAAQVREALERLLAKKLVRQNLLSWKDYSAARERARSAAASAAGEATQGAAVKVAPVAAMPPERQAGPAAAPVRAQVGSTAGATPQNGSGAAQEGVALRLGSISPQKSAVGATNAWVWQKPDAAQVAATQAAAPAAQPNGVPAGGRLLRPILAQIESLKGGGVEGQLLAYQVFLRVPYDLLYDEGIKSLHFVDQHTVIRNPALYEAIVKAAKEVTGADVA